MNKQRQEEGEQVVSMCAEEADVKEVDGKGGEEVTIGGMGGRRRGE